MKKKSKKKLPRYWLGTRKPTSLGYQANRGIGDSLTTTTLGQSIQPEVSAMKANQIPNAVAKAGSSLQFPMQMAQNMSAIPKYTTQALSATASLAPSIATGLVNTGLKGSAYFAGNSLRDIAGSATGGKLLSPTQMTKQASVQTGTSQALNTAGTVLGALGTAYGLYNVGADIANAGDHISQSQIRDTATKTTYTTAGGNTYDQYGGVDASGVMAYENQDRKAKQIGLTMDAIGLGSSVGGLVGGTALAGSIGGPLGMGIGAGLGLLAGGVASLLGFGDNSEEVEKMIKNQEDVFAMQNRQSESDARDKDIKAAFYNRAANGKLPGYSFGKPNARVSNGEVIGNFKDGYFRMPGVPNNDDTKKIHLGKQDFVISNKHGLSDYAWLTGDIPGALAAQSYLQKTGQMNKYKNGRLPKFDAGTKGRWTDVAFSMIPHGISAAQNLTQLLRAQNADIYAPDFYVENPEGAKALNELASLRFDADPYYREAQRGLNQANWQVNRLVGLGPGGRAIMKNANYAQYLNGLRDITKMYNEASNSYKEKYANALANLGTTNQGRRMQANAQRHQFLQQANAARENWMAQYRKNIDQNLLNAAADYMRMGQYNDSLAIQNKMLALYEQNAETDKIKADAYINSLGNNNTTNTANLLKAYDAIKKLRYIPSVGYLPIG